LTSNQRGVTALTVSRRAGRDGTASRGPDSWYAVRSLPSSQSVAARSPYSALSHGSASSSTFNAACSSVSVLAGAPPLFDSVARSAIVVKIAPVLVTINGGLHSTLHQRVQEFAHGTCERRGLSAGGIGPRMSGWLATSGPFIC
jgi:hypothetical protein